MVHTLPGPVPKSRTTHSLFLFARQHQALKDTCAAASISMASPSRKYSLPPTENFRHVIQRDVGEPNIGDGTGKSSVAVFDSARTFGTHQPVSFMQI